MTCQNLALPLPLPPIFADRAARLRSNIFPGAKILEIGGSYNPIVRRSEGFDCFSLDHASAGELSAKYVGHFAHPPEIEPVDFVCQDGNIVAAIPTEHHGSFDVCLLSHAIEHVTNPILLLQSIEAMLKPNGVLTMAVPDKRGCFDIFRPLTSTGEWIFAFRRNASVHSATARFEFQAYNVLHNGLLIWPQGVTDNFSFADPIGLQSGYEALCKVGDAGSGEYVDIHSWIFVPSSLVLIFYELHALGLMRLLPSDVHTGGGFEFFLNLRREDRPALTNDQRILLLKHAAREQAEAFSVLSI